MKKFLLPLALMSALLVSCEKPENNEPEQEPESECTVSVSPSELIFGAEGGEQTVTVSTTTGFDWSYDSYIGGLPDWCEYYSDGDEVTIHVSPNFSSAERECTLEFYISLGEANAELKVFQEVDNSSIIQFKDPLFLQVLQDRGADYNGDGQISIMEASFLTELYCNEKGIRAMDEIKYFTALEHLWCYNNQLTSLDLSNNTALEYLNCGGNQLTSLDVSKNTALEHLWCYNNQLTSLDVSNNTALTYLDCSGNQLTELNLNLNTNTVLSVLTELRCWDNQLTSLDLSNCTALTYLDCSRNPLQKLILYKYHLIDGIESEYGDIIEYKE